MLEEIAVKKPAGYSLEALSTLTESIRTEHLSGDFYAIDPTDQTEKRCSLMGIETYKVSDVISCRHDLTPENLARVDSFRSYCGNHVSNVNVMARSICLLEHQLSHPICNLLDPFAGVGGSVISGILLGSKKIVGIEYFENVFSDLVSTVKRFLLNSNIKFISETGFSQRCASRFASFELKDSDTDIFLYNASTFNIFDKVFEGQEIATSPPWASQKYPALLPDGTLTCSTGEFFGKMAHYFSSFDFTSVMIRPRDSEIPLVKIKDFLTSEANYQISVYTSK